MDNDFFSWVTILDTVGIDDFPHVLNQGIIYLQYMIENSNSSYPLDQSLVQFCKEKLPNIIHKIYHAILINKKSNGDEYCNFLFHAMNLFIRPINSHSFFYLMSNFFSFNSDFASAHPELINFLGHTFLSLTGNFQFLMEGFLSTPFQSIENFATFYLLLNFFNNEIDSTIIERAFNQVTPVFLNVLQQTKSNTIRKIPIYYLLLLFNNLFPQFHAFFEKRENFLPLFEFFKEATRCDVLEKKIYGLHMFLNLLNASDNGNLKESIYQYFCETKLLDELFENQQHHEVLKVTERIFEEMANRHFIHTDLVDKIYHQSLAIPKSSTESDLYYKIIVKCLPSLQQTEITSFLSFIFLNDQNFPQLFKKAIVENIETHSDISVFILNCIGQECQNNEMKKCMCELIDLGNPKITQNINQITSQWINSRVFHLNAYEIIYYLFQKSKTPLTFDGDQFLNYIADALLQRNDEENSKKLIDLFYNSIVHFKTTISHDIVKGLYQYTPINLFWSFINRLLNESGIKPFVEHQNLFQLAISDDNLASQTEETFTFIIQYYLKYSSQIDHTIEERDKCIILVNTNEILSIIFQLYKKIINPKFAEMITNFLINLSRNARLPMNKLTQFYLNNCVNLIQEASIHSCLIYNLIQSYIDVIEGEIDLRIFESKRIKTPNNLFPLEIVPPNKQKIMINVSRKTTTFALKNILSAYFQVPVCSIELFEKKPNIRTVKFLNLENETDKAETVVYINQMNDLPSFIFAEPGNVRFFIEQLKGEMESSKAVYKILCRTKFVPMQEDNSPDFYFNAFNDTDNNQPYHFLFMTQRLKCFLADSSDSQVFFTECFSSLLQNILNKKYHPRYLKIAFELVTLYFNPDIKRLSIPEIQTLIKQAVNYPKYTAKYLSLAAKLLPINVGLEIPHTDLITIIKSYHPNTLIQKNDSMQQNDVLRSIVSLISAITNHRILSDFINDILTNTDSYFNVNEIIKPVIQNIFDRFPDLMHSFLYQIIEIIKPKNHKSSAVFSNIIKIYVNKIQEIPESIDLTDTINHLLFNVAFKTINIKIQQPIFDLFFEIDEQSQSLQYAFLMSMLSKEFPSYKYDPLKYIRPFKSMSGLTNQGCTCYMNSVLQQLISIPEVLKNLANSRSRNLNLRSDIEQLFTLFAKSRFGSNLSYNTKEYCRAYSHFMPEFNTNIQEDASEYLNTLFDSFPNQVQQLFKGKFTNYIVRDEQSRQEISSHFEEFSTVDLTIKDVCNLSASMKMLLSDEKLTGENRYTDGNGNKVDACRFTRFHTLPPYLVFHLKRFEYNLVEFQRIKINSKFEFPTTLNMDEYFDHGGLYHLRGAVLHIGIADGGHYLSIIQNNSQNQNKKWICCDDTNLYEISEDDFLKNAYGGEGNCNAYLLFFEKNDIHNISMNADEGCCDDINESNSQDEVFSMLPEYLRNEITESNNRIIECSSLLTQASFDFFKKLIPNEVSTLYFFNVLCHANNTDMATNFADHLSGCSNFIIADTQQFLTILNNCPYSDTDNAITSLASKDADLHYLQVLFEHVTLIKSSRNLISSLGNILFSSVQQNGNNHEFFSLILDFLVNKLLTSSKESRQYNLSLYFETLIYGSKLSFDISPLLQFSDQIKFNKQSCVNFIRLLVEYGNDTNTINEIFGNDIIIKKYLPIAYITIPRFYNDTLFKLAQNEYNTVATLYEMNILIKQRTRKSIIVKTLKQNHEIIVNLLLNNRSEVRITTVQLIISIFGSNSNSNANNNNNTNSGTKLDYENVNPKNNKYTICFAEALIMNIHNITPNRNMKKDNLVYLEYFRTINWLFRSGITIDCSYVIEKLIEIVNALSEVKNSFDLTILEIAKLNAFMKCPFILLDATFNAFFRHKKSISNQKIPEAVDIFLPQIVFHFNTNQYQSFLLINSRKFKKLCRFVFRLDGFQQIQAFDNLYKVCLKISEIIPDLKSEFCLNE